MKYKHGQDFYASASSLPQKHKFLGALIGGAISLIGGAKARSDAKKRDAAAAAAAEELKNTPVVTDAKAETSHVVDLPGLVKAAQDAGFNPMTILNAGGLSAFTKSTTTNWSSVTGANAAAAAQMSVPTAPSMGTVVAGALSAGYNIYREDQAAKKAYETAALSSFPSRPTATLGSILSGTPAGGNAGGGGAQFAAKSALVAGAPQVPDFEKGTKVNPHSTWKVDPTIPSAEDGETEYGDLLGNVFGVRNLYLNTLYNLSGKTEPERHKYYAEVYESAKTGAMGMATNAMEWVQKAVGPGTAPKRTRAHPQGPDYWSRVAQ